jgi:hypothetical protein
MFGYQSTKYGSAGHISNCFSACGTYENELRPNSLKDTKKGSSVYSTLEIPKTRTIYQYCLTRATTENFNKKLLSTKTTDYPNPLEISSDNEKKSEVVADHRANSPNNHVKRGHRPKEGCYPTSIPPRCQELTCDNYGTHNCHKRKHIRKRKQIAESFETPLKQTKSHLRTPPI